jgi:hypothetical protein
MVEKRPASRKEMIGIGCIAAVAGTYFLLIGAGVLPVPGGPKNLHGPLWIVLGTGLAFFLGGAAVILQVLGRANEQGELPAQAPFWMRAGQYLIGLAIFASFAAIGSWIAFGPGERAFSGSFGLFEGNTGAAIGRTAFGIGAVIVWVATIAFAVSGARKLFGRNKSGSH